VALNPTDWASFRSRFIATDGRVMDNGNGGVSHSEGQGWGMLFAVAANDRPTFESIRAWTTRTLRRPDDTLHAWRYMPNATPPVEDWNNATDGDLFIATALARAGYRWSAPEYLQAAAGIARDILKLLVRDVGSHLVLLPGVNGFENEHAVVLNPSYYALPMLAELARLAPSARWQQLIRDGTQLIARAQFGQWQLPPDWLLVTRPSLQLSVAPGWAPRFSFDAIRIPLWSTWGKRPIGQSRLAMARFWGAYPVGAAPAWVDLATNETAPYALTPGMAAVARLTLASVDGSVPILPAVATAHKYYDAALIMLCQLAWQETRG
jgi:endoglucanase